MVEFNNYKIKMVEFNNNYKIELVQSLVCIHLPARGHGFNTGRSTHKFMIKQPCGSLSRIYEQPYIRVK